MNVQKKKVLVVGLGKTGEALCNFLLRRGAQVKVSEKKSAAAIKDRVDYWTKKGAVVETGGHALKSFVEAELIVPSPGVPMLPEMREARARGIQILSEIELASLFLRGKIVGITGSNGKSTTATLAHKILKDGGLKAFLAGNIGTPLISFAEQSRDSHVFVTELSSFQLAYTEHFRTHVSVFLNVSPDHLDWHPDFEDYLESKSKLIAQQRETDTAILNRDDLSIWKLRQKKKMNVLGFSRSTKNIRGCFLQNGWIILADPSKEMLIKTSEIPLLGLHNQENIMAAALVGHVFGLSPSRIRESIKTFKGLPHRLEKVLTAQGVDFYNDSKATNVDATFKSIMSFKKKIILILGGRDKGGDFTRLREPILQQVKKVLLIGEAREKIKEALADTVPLVSVQTMKEAVEQGFLAAEPGDVVLLAPACTSFDMFQNFEERGEVFKEHVLSLANKLKKNEI